MQPEPWSAGEACGHGQQAITRDRRPAQTARHALTIWQPKTGKVVVPNPLQSARDTAGQLIATEYQLLQVVDNWTSSGGIAPVSWFLLPSSRVRSVSWLYSRGMLPWGLFHPNITPGNFRARNHGIAPQPPFLSSAHDRMHIAADCMRQTTEGLNTHTFGDCPSISPNHRPSTTTPT